MRMPTLPTRLLLLSLAVLSVACGGPTELATPTAGTAAEVVRAAFPDASVTVREVERTDQTLRAPAEFNGADVVFLFGQSEGAWQVTGVEQGGNTYTVGQLREIAATMAVMRDVSDALEAYKAATGAYPMLDDLVGLRQLIPDYYTADAPLEDAWAQPLRYRLQGEDYIVTSTGPDAEPSTSDDIILITGKFVAAE